MLTILNSSMVRANEEQYRKMFKLYWFDNSVLAKEYGIMSQTPQSYNGYIDYCRKCYLNKSNETWTKEFNKLCTVAQKHHVAIVTDYKLCNGTSPAEVILRLVRKATGCEISHNAKLPYAQYIIGRKELPVYSTIVGSTRKHAYEALVVHAEQRRVRIVIYAANGVEACSLLKPFIKSCKAISSDNYIVVRSY